MQAGRHTLTCRIPRLPLTAGDYLVRASVFDAQALVPLSLFGWENAPARLQVQSDTSLEKNLQKIMQQLVTIEVEWM